MITVPWTWEDLRDLELPADLERLRRQYERDCAATPGQGLRDPEASRAWADIVGDAWADHADAPVLARRAAMLTAFAEHMPVQWRADELLAGRQTFFPPRELTDKQRERFAVLGVAWNGGHVVHDYGRWLRLGLPGCRALVADMDAGPVRAAFATALDAAARYLERWSAGHPELGALLERPPRTYPEALQMVFLAQVLLHAENPASAISFGRLDQYCWPFLEADLAAGRLLLPDAVTWTGAFFLKCCEGGESQNLVLGGVDEAGADAVNPLSFLLLGVMKALQAPQPSLCVRLHPGTDPEFADAAADLAAVGTGQPGFISDAAAIPALQAVGIPRERAWDYAIVGCYEATTQGDCYANTTGSGFSLPESLAGWLRTRKAREPRRFETFLRRWEGRMERDYERVRRQAQKRWNHWRDHAPSAFGSILMRGCIARGIPMEAGGADYNLMGVNVLGLGTAVDSLNAIRELVYERGELTLDELAEQLAADWPEERLRREALSLPGRYGTDAPNTNHLAARLANRVADVVLASRLANGVRPCPALFRFYADMGQHPFATPDGRRVGERLSYGVGPADAVESTVTGVLQSAAALPHHRFACGNPLALSLSRRDLHGRGAAILRALVDSYFAAGGFHLHVNIVSAAQLRRAQEKPESHAALTVRVSGFSARFVTVGKHIQEALIDRAERGR